MENRKLKAGFHTLGCKVNHYETEMMEDQFRRAGYEITDGTEFADVYVVNTCTVTHLADRKSRQQIRKLKKMNPKAIVAVTGCYAQVSKEDILAIDDVDVICGTDEKHNLIDYVNEYISKKNSGEEGVVCYVRDYEDLDTYHSAGILKSMEDMTRAYVKIQEGCNRFCSYCIIPYSRGKVRSRDKNEIVTEVSGLIEAGYKEIVLTGINTALYGTDTGDGGIEPLIAKLDSLDGEFRIRLSSLEPTVINAEYVRGLMKYDKLCHHLHLSVQSGSDRVLKRMNRRHDRQQYLDIVRVLREFDPNYGISTDIIVGFPGETEEDFQDSMNMIEEAFYCRTHVFRYSKRKGTPAATMENQVKNQDKKRRASELISEGERISLEFREACKGEVRRVLFEEMTEDGFITGYTDNYVKIYVEGREDLLNCFAKVQLLSIWKDGMKGGIVNE